MERAEIARGRRRLLRGRLRLTLVILVVERTDPSAAVARPRIDVSLLQQNQLLAKRHQLGHYADPLGRRPAPAGSGQIDQLGDGVSGFQIGDRVADMTVVGSNAADRTLRADRLDLRLGP